MVSLKFLENGARWEKTDFRFGFSTVMRMRYDSFYLKNHFWSRDKTLKTDFYVMVSLKFPENGARWEKRISYSDSTRS